jgi:ribosome-associated protein
MTATTRTSADITSYVRLVASAALDRKAVGLKVLHLEPVTDFTDYFVVLSGTNERQVHALADGIVRTLRDHKVKPLHVEGLRNAQWVLLDYGDFVVHVFDEERRAFYGLERLWADAPEVTEELSS